MTDTKGKRRILSLMILVAAVWIGGCQGSNETVEGVPMGTSTEEVTEYEFLKEEELEWKDNSLDDWQAVINLPLKEVKADGETAGGTIKYFSGAGGAVRFKTHLLGNHKKSWSGASGTNDSGEDFSVEIKVDQERVGMQIDLLGPVSGEKAYVAVKCARDNMEKITGLWLYRLDEGFEKTWEAYAGFPMEEQPTDVSGDAEGNVHLTYYDFELRTYQYVILSSEGKLVFEASGNFSKGLREFAQGRVAVHEVLANGTSQRLLEADVSQGSLSEIGSLDYLALHAETGMREMMIFFVTPVTERELAWCGMDGLYLCNAEGKENRMAYRWANHGILVQEVRDVYAAEDGTITVIYKDADGMNVLILKPTRDKTEIKTITLAVSPHHREAYEDAAAYFNKKYPAYNIEIKDDYDETSLLTQLGAGGGPVLIDTALTGFEELEKLWQPLDGFLEESGLEDELIPETMEFGKIDGKTYGIVTNFFIRTLVVTDESLADWDYDTFIKRAEGFEGSILTYEYGQENSDNRSFFFSMLSNGLEDNAWLDAEKDVTIFGTSEFERVLRVSEKAKRCPSAEDGKAIREGKAMCEIVNVANVEELVRLRARVDAGERILGYPTKSGARFRLVSQNPISLRRTASEEEKRIAYTFFKILLSHDSAAAAQSNVFKSEWFSVRKDVLEMTMDRYARRFSDGELSGIDYPEPSRERDVAFFEELIRTSVVQKNFPAGLQRVFDEEFGDYLAGRIDGEALSDHLKSRTWLYLEEAK